MRRTLSAFLAVLLIVVPVARLVAHVRLIHPTNGAPLYWSSPASIGIVIHSPGSDDIADGSDETALRLAIQDWNAVPGTAATLVEDRSEFSRARADYESNDVHLILFDEDDRSGFFPAGSSTVALTPVWFYANGAIEDADILFNGRGFSFATDGASNRFDVQDVAAHELGHLLGLDHSGLAGSTLYPYVDQGLILKRSLSEDELCGLRDAYPAGSSGRISGTIVRAADGSGVAGAYVVARDAAGRSRTSILASASGSFTLRGLDPGRYTVYARPFDGAVDEVNLGWGYRGGIDTDFEPATYAAQAELSGSGSVALGTLQVGSDCTLSLGRPLDPFPLRVVAGASQTMLVHGSGLFTGSTLEVSDPDLILGAPLWLGTQVSFPVTVPADEEPGHVDLTVTNAEGRVTILSAALEITPPSPSVSALSPNSGTIRGGTSLTLSGAGFRPLSRVVIGECIYTEGVDAKLVDSSTITLTQAATSAGVHDVVVIDPSGVEGRLTDGFVVHSAPEIHNVLPRAGDSLGGTPVLLAGQGFSPGLLVRIDGLDQGPVSLEGETGARFTTRAGVAGGPHVLELVNPDGARSAQAFHYVDQRDALVTAVTPGAASASGGTTLTLTGAHFTPTMDLWFYADPLGEPIAADAVTFVDPTRLEVVAPRHPPGSASLLLFDSSGSGVFTDGALTFTNGSRGGSCSFAFSAPATGFRGLLEGAWWLLACLAVLVLRARAGRRAARSLS